MTAPKESGLFPSSSSGRGNALAQRGRGEGVRRTTYWGLALILAPLPFLAATAPHSTNSPDHPISFGRDVRPILSANCFKCHGHDPEVRQAGLRLDTFDGATAKLEDDGHAIVPGNPNNSALIARVTSTDPDDRMPPIEVNKHGLKPEDIETLRQWIQSGAKYEQHWSFTPPTRKPAPAVSDTHWCRNDMDRWVLATLDREHLKPSPEAPTETLLRRVSLDLIGLPPSPQELDAFLADKSPDAYEKAVDRLLASPHFGEKWARWWLDLARYADTKGYEKDERRTVWPYRDWVIRAFNDDIGFDQFTIQQLAGDMLPSATRDQIVATAFHRNTMTNDEGGTDNEEFRTAAVIDRVNTTMEVWQGLTMACAQCHSHKYDPVSQTDYYRMFAIFNNTEDADAEPETPYLRLLDADQEKSLAAAQSRLTSAESAITKQIADTAPSKYHLTLPPRPASEPRDHPWLDDSLPARSTPSVQNLTPTWNWIPRDTLSPASGERCFGGKGGAGGGAAQQFVEHANPPLEAAEGDALYAYVYLDPANPPKEIMLQWFAADGGWEHRAFWGDDKINFGGATGTPSRLRLGDLPEPGKWARLEIDAKSVGLAANPVTGWAFTQFEGAVYWDNAGLRTSRPIDDRYLASLPAWIERERAADAKDLPDTIAAGVRADDAARTPDQDAALADYYLRNIHAETRAALVPLETEADAARAEVASINNSAINLPVMHELAGDARRRTHRFVRGSFLNPAEEVSPGAPEVFATAESSAADPTNRLELAHWFLSPENPLTARVIANRLWEQLWGSGIVETVEDFGTQGAWPTDPDLLDHIALQLQRDRWSIKQFLRYLVTSATYRQSSNVSDELLALDSANKLLARGPRFRLDAENIRDAALAASGLLSEKMYGPPVFPPQPDGLWIMIYNSDRWMTSTGEDRYRRGLYTFWRRTVPHPAMTTFDAPSREFCVSRRIRTDTPLQSLVTLNDPAYIECAQAMARRVLHDAGPDDAARLTYALKLAVSRAPTPDELHQLATLLDSERAHYRADPDDALKAATDPLGDLPAELEAPEAAAWTSVCNVILNLDETLTKE